MKRRSKDDFIQSAINVHENKYDYSEIDYITSIHKISIICKIHCKFMQAPKGHLLGYGCPQCGYKNRHNPRMLTNIEFIQRASEIHGNTYDYSSTYFTGYHRKIIIICPKHGTYSQIATNHLKGSGCHKCSFTNSSKLEQNWLNYIGLPNTPACRQVRLVIDNQKIKVDGYNPETNTVYEFWGDFWHGNPKRFNPDDINLRNKKTFSQLYEETQIKRQLILDAGYNLIEIWETEWNYLQKNISDK